MCAGPAPSVPGTSCAASPVPRSCTAKRTQKKRADARGGLSRATETQAIEHTAQRANAGCVVLSLTEVERLTERPLGFLEAIRLGARGAVERPQARVCFLEQRRFAQRHHGLTALAALLRAARPPEEEFGARRKPGIVGVVLHGLVDEEQKRKPCHTL